MDGVGDTVRGVGVLPRGFVWRLPFGVTGLGAAIFPLGSTGEGEGDLLPRKTSVEKGSPLLGRPSTPLLRTSIDECGEGGTTLTFGLLPSSELRPYASDTARLLVVKALAPDESGATRPGNGLCEVGEGLRVCERVVSLEARVWVAGDLLTSLERNPGAMSAKCKTYVLEKTGAKERAAEVEGTQS